MRTEALFALFLASGLAGLGQTATTTPLEGLPKDPRAVFAAAAPFYDFSDPALEPWHLKATYQLYDDKGKPTEQGTFEYWWASPKAYRSTWTRPGASHTDWHSAEGKYLFASSGQPLQYFEYKLQSALLSPLPDSSDLDPAKIRLAREEKHLGNVKLPCIMVIPLMPEHGQIQTVPLGLFPTYCFGPDSPALRASYSFGALTMQFNDLVKVQGRLLARDLAFFGGKPRILSARVELIEEIASDDPAFTPPADATPAKAGRVQLGPGITVGMLVKKQAPVYPQDARDARISGTVVLKATIGVDGRIHELRAVEAPSPSFAASAMSAVLHWEYKPYMVNGEPEEVDTTINVIFSIGR